MHCQTAIVAFNWMQRAFFFGKDAVRGLWWGFVGIHGICRSPSNPPPSSSAFDLRSVCEARDHEPEKLKAPSHETTHRHLIKHLTFHLWGANVESARTHTSITWTIMKFCSHSFDAGLFEMTLSHHINNKYLALKVDQRQSKTTLLSQAAGCVVHPNCLMLCINHTECEGGKVLFCERTQ